MRLVSDALTLLRSPAVNDAAENGGMESPSVTGWGRDVVSCKITRKTVLLRRGHSYAASTSYTWHGATRRLS